MNIANILASKGSRVVTIRPDQTVREALERFAERNIGALVVVDDAHRAVGMITERGILRSALTKERVLSEAVGSVMTREVVIGHPSDDLMSVAHYGTLGITEISVFRGVCRYCLSGDRRSWRR